MRLGPHDETRAVHVVVDHLRTQHEVADLLALLQTARHTGEEDAPHVEMVAHRRGLRPRASGTTVDAAAARRPALQAR